MRALLKVRAMQLNIQDVEEAAQASVSKVKRQQAMASLEAAEHGLQQAQYDMNQTISELNTTRNEFKKALDAWKSTQIFNAIFDIIGAIISLGLAFVDPEAIGGAISGALDAVKSIKALVDVVKSIKSISDMTKTLRGVRSVER